MFFYRTSEGTLSTVWVFSPKEVFLWQKEDETHQNKQLKLKSRTEDLDQSPCFLKKRNK